MKGVIVLLIAFLLFSGSVASGTPRNGLSARNSHKGDDDWSDGHRHREGGDNWNDGHRHREGGDSWNDGHREHGGHREGDGHGEGDWNDDHKRSTRTELATATRTITTVTPPVNGSVSITCSAYCNNTCVDLLSDTDNCGACNAACGAPAWCSNGHCVPLPVEGPEMSPVKVDAFPMPTFITTFVTPTEFLSHASYNVTMTFVGASDINVVDLSADKAVRSYTISNDAKSIIVDVYDTERIAGWIPPFSVILGVGQQPLALPPDVPENGLGIYVFSAASVSCSTAGSTCTIFGSFPNPPSTKLAKMSVAIDISPRKSAVSRRKRAMGILPPDENGYTGINYNALSFKLELDDVTLAVKNFSAGFWIYVGPHVDVEFHLGWGSFRHVETVELRGDFEFSLGGSVEVEGQDNTIKAELPLSPAWPIPDLGCTIPGMVVVGLNFQLFWGYAFETKGTAKLSFDLKHASSLGIGAKFDSAAPLPELYPIDTTDPTSHHPMPEIEFTSEFSGKVSLIPRLGIDLKIGNKDEIVGVDAKIPISAGLQIRVQKATGDCPVRISPFVEVEGSFEAEAIRKKTSLKYMDFVWVCDPDKEPSKGRFQELQLFTPQLCKENNLGCKFGPSETASAFSSTTTRALTVTRTTPHSPITTGPSVIPPLNPTCEANHAEYILGDNGQPQSRIPDPAFCATLPNAFMFKYIPTWQGLSFPDCWDRACAQCYADPEAEPSNVVIDECLRVAHIMCAFC